MHTEAAQLLMQLAKTEASLQATPLRLKKLYLLAALELDAFKARMLQIGDDGLQAPAHPGSPQQPGSTASHTLAGDFSTPVALNMCRHCCCICSYTGAGLEDNML